MHCIICINGHVCLEHIAAISDFSPYIILSILAFYFLCWLSTLRRSLLFVTALQVCHFTQLVDIFAHLSAPLTAHHCSRSGSYKVLKQNESQPSHSQCTAQWKKLMQQLVPPLLLSVFFQNWQTGSHPDGLISRKDSDILSTSHNLTVSLILPPGPQRLYIWIKMKASYLHRGGRKIMSQIFNHMNNNGKKPKGSNLDSIKVKKEKHFYGAH